MWSKQSTHCNYVKQNIVSHYNLFIPLMKRKFLSLLDKSSVDRYLCGPVRVYVWYTYDRDVFMIFLRSGCVYDLLTILACLYVIYLRCGCIYDILTIKVCLHLIYIRCGCVWYTYDAGVFTIYLWSVYIWYTYDPVCLYLIYLRSGRAYNLLLMYLWCSYDVNLRCFANSLYSAQYTITTLSPSLYVFFTYPAIRNIS